jgi:glycerophosphoryl diester phosphodiesterase
MTSHTDDIASQTNAAAPQADARRNVHPFFLGARHRLEVIAHRGGGGQWPGETLFAFERAVEIGVDVLEMDAHSTRDGHLVLMHNKTVQQTTNGTGGIKRLTLSQIKELDAGYCWTADGGRTYPYRTPPGGRVPDDLRVPTLDKVFERFKSQPHVRMNIEIKQASPPIAGRLCHLIRHHGMTERVLVASGHDSSLREFRRLCPEVATSASLVELLKFRVMNHVFGAGADGLGYDALQLSSTALVLDALLLKKPLGLPFISHGYCETARRAGLPVHGWTVNHPAEMERLIHLKVDGIITDYPSSLLALLGRQPPNATLRRLAP